MKTKYEESLIPYLYEGVYVVDKARKIIFWNEGCEIITGYTAEEVLNSYCYDNILQHIDEQGNKLCIMGCPLLDTIKKGIVNKARIYLKHKDGYRIPVNVKTQPIYDQDNHIVAAIEVFTDERFQRHIYEENVKLKDKLKTDPLTNTANRHFFDFQFSKRIDEAKTFKNIFGLLIIDIDDFKHVNDTYGHLIGDEVLKIVAKSLASNVAKPDLISRWGGEEFVGLINVDNNEALLMIAERLRHVVQGSSYIMEDGKTIDVTVSIGGSLFNDNDDQKSLIKRADEYMYEAKKNGKNQSVIK